MPLPLLRSTSPLPLPSPLPPIRVLALTSPLLESVADASLGVFEVDLRTHQASWSAALLRMFDFGSEPHVSAADALSRVHPDDASTRQSAVDRVSAAGPDQAYVLDYRVLHRDGSVHWLSVRGRIERDDHDGAAGRIIGVVSDLTALRQASDEIAVTQQRRDRFLALLAHDLRNPLAPLHTAAELMRRAEMQPARVLAISDMLSRQVAQMSQLIDDLVDVSRANQGRIELRRERVDVRSLVEQSVESVRSFVDRRRQIIETSYEDSALAVDADPQRLQQVVTHLLEHASRSSTEDSSIRVTVARSAGALVITVSDDGAGIDAEDVPRVFDLYPPAEHKLNRRQTLGTAMALVKAFVELHGGTVQATSGGAGKGASYSVRIPGVTANAGGQ